MNKSSFLSVFKTIAILFVFGIVSILGYSYLKIYQYTLAASQIDTSKIYVKDSTKIYDKNLQLITELGIEKRDVIKYNNISQEMINALIAIEDARFYNHQGVDYARVIGALIENVKSGSYKEGASTLTQQLVKLSYLTNEKTIDRKIKEIFLSVELENRLTKEEIVEAYLNRVLFGGRIYGVEKASKFYFRKSANELNYEEAALLAGMIQSPNRFNPYINPDETKARQITVLHALFNNGYISKIELDFAIKKPIPELIVEQNLTPKEEKYNEYIDYVIFELINKYKLDPFNDSLHVITHLDTYIQDEVQRIENDEKLHPSDKTQTAIVVIETETGIIRGIGGGRNYQGSMAFNFATDARIQPGSTIKPILDYGPAIEYFKYSPAQPYLDEKIYYNTMGSRFVPVYNYDNKYKGYLTMREAIIDSRNVTAVKAFREVGSDRAYEFASKLGLNTDEIVTEAHAIGGYKYGYSVLQMAGAYAAFGNKGKYIEPTTINYILKDYEPLEKLTTTYQAMRPDTAYLMSHILHDNMITGTATRANVRDLYIAGKTGQTNYAEETREAFHFPSNSVRDSWFIGYTTKYTTAVWLGFDKIGEGTFLSPDDAKKSLEIFKTVMDKIHRNRHESTDFFRPDSIIEVEVETNTYPLSLPNEYTPSMYRRKELFISGSEPTTKSNYFQPLDKPKNFIVYYDENNANLVFKWDRYNYDYTDSDFRIMEAVHSIQNYYDYYKNKTQREFFDNKQLTYKTISRIQSTLNNYCNSNKKLGNHCPLQTNSLDDHLGLLEALKQYEISEKLKDKNMEILSEGEISVLRGYSTWNGYQNGIYSNLGAIEYQIVGNIGSQAIVLYRGPYVSELVIPMDFLEFLQFDTFSITADYTRYRNVLKSDSNVSINPFLGYQEFM